MNFIKTTTIGGIVFMVPIIIIIVILGKAFELILIESIGGIAFVNRPGRGSQAFQTEI